MNKKAAKITLYIGIPVVIMWIVSNFSWKIGDVTMELNSLGQLVFIIALLYIAYILIDVTIEKKPVHMKFGFKEKNKFLILRGEFSSESKRNLEIYLIKFYLSHLNGNVIKDFVVVKEIKIEFKGTDEIIKKDVHTFNPNELNGVEIVSFELSFKDEQELDNNFFSKNVPELE